MRDDVTAAGDERVQHDVEFVPDAFNGTTSAPSADRHLEREQLPSLSAGSRGTGYGVGDARRIHAEGNFAALSSERQGGVLVPLRGGRRLAARGRVLRLHVSSGCSTRRRRTTSKAGLRYQAECPLEHPGARNPARLRDPPSAHLQRTRRVLARGPWPKRLAMFVPACEECGDPWLPDAPDILKFWFPHSRRAGTLSFA
jgi:hypothetical protein